MMRRAILTALGACVGALWAFWAPPVASHQGITTTVVFDREIVRILTKRCVACHTENNLAFPLTTYEETRPWARSIEEEALRRHMPPWRAVPGYGHFVNDNGLTMRELEFVVSWAEGGGPNTAGQTVFFSVSQSAKSGSIAASRADFERWQHGDPDLLRQLPAHVIARGQPNHTQRSVLDLGLNSDRWVTSIEFKPGDRRVLRAAFFTLQETGQWLGSWTPWYGVTTLPVGTAYLVPAGSHVVVELHYVGAGETVEDRGTLGFRFSETRPASRVSELVLEAAEDIPANTGRHRLRAHTALPADTHLVALRPEFLPGIQSLEVAARKPDGGTEVLLFVRDILLEWPTPYIFRDSIFLPKGSELSVTGYYMNPGDTPQPGTIRLAVSRYEEEARTASTPGAALTAERDRPRRSP